MRSSRQKRGSDLSRLILTIGYEHRTSDRYNNPSCAIHHPDIVRLKLTLIQLQAELIEEGIAKGVYSQAVYQVIQGSVCERNEEAKKILKKTKAWTRW